VDAQKLVVDDGGEGQIIEELHDGFVNFLIVFGKA
jgi:hypothetical protein